MTLTGLRASSPKNPVTVAITQIVPHSSLDLIRKGIEDELKEQKIECEILFENAQGNIAIAAQIAKKFVSLNPDVIVPITTPSTQAVYAAANSRNIPVIFAAVNDPVVAKLVPAMDQAGNGITGLSDLPPVDEQVALIHEILPNAKKIGVVYNPGESNSVELLKLFEKILMQNGMTLFRAMAANMIDVAAATKSLVGKVDAIYIPNDNTVVAALEALIKVTRENEIPVFCADPESVKQGCLATVTHSQYGLGRQTGKMVAKLLNGTDIQTLPVERPAVVELSVNQDAARALNISLPASVLARAQHVIKKEEKNYGPPS
jgi:putative ABC transport system substrate-binding protein